jgi:hypothetical protein
LYLNLLLVSQLSGADREKGKKKGAEKRKALEESYNC